MSEKLLSPATFEHGEIDINMAGINYYRNGPYLAVERHIDSRSQHDLLPLYTWFARSKYRFEEATWVKGSYDRTKVQLAELFLEDSVCSLDTLTFNFSQFFDAHVAGKPSLYTVEEAVGRIREKDEGVFLDVSLSLVSPDQQADAEIAVIEKALASSDIAYHHKRKNANPELYLGTLRTPADFDNANVDEFLDTLLEETPPAIETEPFVVQRPSVAA